MQQLYYTLFDIRAIVSVNVNNITAAPPSTRASATARKPANAHEY